MKIMKAVKMTKMWTLSAIYIVLGWIFVQGYIKQCNQQKPIENTTEIMDSPTIVSLIKILTLQMLLAKDSAGSIMKSERMLILKLHHQISTVN